MLPPRLGRPEAKLETNTATGHPLNEANTDPREQLLALEGKIESLLSLHGRMREEILSLKARYEEGLKERAVLIGKNNTTKNRADAMIARLKQLGY